MLIKKVNNSHELNNLVAKIKIKLDLCLKKLTNERILEIQNLVNELREITNAK